MDSYAETATGIVLIVNGIDVALVWTGYGTVAEPAGVVAPATAPGIDSSLTVGPISGTYFAFVRFLDNRGNFSNLSPISNPAVVLSRLSINYSSVPVSSEAAVVRRQILRNLDGETDTFYVDIDTTDLGSTTFSSTRVDLDLATQTAVVIADQATQHGVPPDYKPFAAIHQNRAYLAGVETYREGSCEVTLGSATVIGRGTEWKATFAGRQLYTPNGQQLYDIAACDPIAQTLTLTVNYTGSTDLFAVYAIRPVAAESNAFHFSEPDTPEAWDPLNVLTLPEDGDDVTGLFNYQSFLYFAKRRHLYRLTTRTNPATDGLVSLACRRGAVNNRCWVNADETLYLMDEAGVYAYRGDDQGTPLSTQIQDMFRQGTDEGVRINWQASRYFHACHSPQEEVIRWFVALAGDYLPRHMLCYAYKQQRWWIEKYPCRTGASVLGRLGNAAGDVSNSVAQYFVGSSADVVLAPGTVALDANPVGGTVSGTVSSASTCSLTDANASFGPDAVGAPVAISAGRGRLQVRQVVAASGGRLDLDRPWRILPDSNSEYVLGGIPWEYQTQRLRWQPGESEGTRFGEMEFFPTETKQQARILFLPDFAGSQNNRYPIDQGFRPNVLAEENQPGQDINMQEPSGFMVIRNDGHREAMNTSATGRVVRFGMTGVGGVEQARFGTIVINGAIG